MSRCFFAAAPDDIASGVYGTISWSISSGYTFNFWSDSITEALEAVLTNITADKEVWANYTPNNYIVRYNGNGKTSGEMEDQPFTYDVAQNLYKNEFEKTDCFFLGWDTDEAAKTVVYTDEQNVINLTSENGGVVDLYAVWGKGIIVTAKAGEGGTATPREKCYQIG